MIYTSHLAEDRKQAMSDDCASQATAFTLERRADGLLWALRGEDEKQVHVLRCFPWSEPSQYVSLRDEDGIEFALVRDVADLAPDSRRVLEETLIDAGFVLQVEAVLELDKEIEIRTWKVRTRQGERSFQTRLDDWPREVPGGGLVIRDVAGDLYHVAAPGMLDAKSQKLLWAFVD